MTQQLKEPERKKEGIGSRVEDSDGSDVVISSQLKGENREEARYSRFTRIKFHDLCGESQFNPKYFENRMTLNKAKQLTRYNEAKFQGTFGV